MRLKLISCEVLYREVCALVARSPNFVDVEFLPKGLHDQGSARMLQRLQEALDRAGESRYEAVLLAYGLCGNGLAGLKANSRPLVVPRAHDCITLFLGSKERYLDYFNQNPGVFFRTTGWIERGDSSDAVSQLSLRAKGLEVSYEELVARYGEDNAGFLYAELGNLVRNYSHSPLLKWGSSPAAASSRPAARKPPGAVGSLRRCGATCRCCSTWWTASGTKAGSWWCRRAGTSCPLTTTPSSPPPALPILLHSSHNA